MRKYLGIVPLLLAAACISGIQAGEPRGGLGLRGPLFPSWLPRCGGCPDDYCGKPEPCLLRPCDWTCSDYCRKSQPCLQRPCDFRCDDYDRKHGPCPAPSCSPLNRCNTTCESCCPPRRPWWKWWD